MTGRRAGRGESEYPTRDAETAGGATARPVALRGGVPVPALPRASASCTPARRRAPSAFAARADPAASPCGAGVVLRMDRLELVGLLFSPFLLTSIFVAQPRRAGLPPGRDHRCLPRRRVPERPRGVRRRPARQGPAAAQPAVRRRPARRRAGHGRQPRRRRPLRHARAGRADQRLHLRRRRQRPGVRRRSADASPDAGRLGATPTPSATPTSAPTAGADASGTPVPSVSIPPWDGKERLNILLIGADEQEGGHNTDTLITVSIDPVTKQVAMFSLPRDTVDVPIPPGRAAAVWGRTYGEQDQLVLRRTTAAARTCGRATTGRAATTPSRRSSASSTTSTSSTSSRSTSTASRRSSTRVGGVTINVQVPVVDDAFPGDDGRAQRLYIPSGHPAHGRRRRPCATPGRATPRPTSTAARASSASCCRCASRPIRRPCCPQLPELVDALKRRSGPTSRSTSSTSCSAWRRRSTRRTSARTCSRRRCTRQDTCARTRAAASSSPTSRRIRHAVKNAFTVDPARRGATRGARRARAPASGC